MRSDVPILCVDNEPDSVEMTLMWLKTKGCEAISVATCEEALELFETQKFELCIVDYRMPDLTGIELCQKARQKWPTMQFILNTADVRQEVQTQAAIAGMHFLPKPTDLDLLHDVVNGIVHCT